MTNKILKTIGLLGGTFDPIHFGHLRMALELQQALDLAKVHLIPCYQPVHRAMPIASAEQRLAMVKAAIAGEADLIADDCEIKRQGPSYTIDTLLHLQKTQVQTALCLIMGIDAFLGFLNWQRADAILDVAHIVVAHRPHYQLPTTGKMADFIKKYHQADSAYLHQHAAGAILFQTITPLEISASCIRKQIANKENARYLLPDEVYHYIKQQGMYHL